ncbi:hypothetical protein EV178_000001, partial [Coemansia sp. RSA 1646]
CKDNTREARKLIDKHFDTFVQLMGIESTDEYCINQVSTVEARKMLVAYLNNIRFQFGRYINKALDLLLNISQLKTQVQQQHPAVSGDALSELFKQEIFTPRDELRAAITSGSFGRLGLHWRAQAALEQLQPVLCTYPRHAEFAKGNLFYDIKANPWRHVKAFFMLSNFFETRGHNDYQCFPVRTSSVPKSITLDTFGLCESIFDVRHKKGQDQQEWGRILRLKSKAIRSQDGLKFKHIVHTDGVSISILKTPDDSSDKGKQKKQDWVDPSDKFDYVEDLPQDRLEEVASNCVYFDPGRRDMPFGMYSSSTADSPELIRYTSNQRNRELHLRRHQQILSKVRRNFQGGAVLQAEAQLATVSSTTSASSFVE